MPDVNAHRELPHQASTPAADGAVWCGLRQTYLTVARELDTRLQATHRLSLGEYDVLRALSHPGCAKRMAGLAEAVGLSPSGLTRSIERLESRGLVHRVSCPDDRRGAMAELTAVGNALLVEASATHDTALHRLLLDQISASEAAHLLRVWQRLAGQAADGCSLGEMTESASHQRERSGCSLVHVDQEGEHGAHD